MSSQDTIKNKSKITKIFGTADVVMIKGTHAEVVDYKFGRGEIDDADVNVQGQAYVLGVMDRFKELETATLHFVAPRRDELMTHEYKREDMETIRLRLRVIVDRASESEISYNPATDVCRFCKHRVHCPALGKKLLPLAQKYEGGDKAFEIMLRDDLSPEMVEDPVVIGRMKQVGTLLKSWMEAVDKKALQLAVEEGKDIDGYDLAFRNPTARIADVGGAYEALKDTLTPEEFMSVCKVTVAALSKVLAEKKPRGEKKNARPEVERALSDEGLLEAAGSEIPYLRKSSTL